MKEVLELSMGENYQTIICLFVGLLMGYTAAKLSNENPKIEKISWFEAFINDPAMAVYTFVKKLRP